MNSLRIAGLYITVLTLHTQILCFSYIHVASLPCVNFQTCVICINFFFCHNIVFRPVCELTVCIHIVGGHQATDTYKIMFKWFLLPVAGLMLPSV